MYLRHLSLTNFRNYARLELDFPTRVVVLQGENAQGKTNLLEAIYYLAITRSPHADSDRQLINWLAYREELPFARLVAEVEYDDGPRSIEITLMQAPESPEMSTPTILRRSFKVNGVKQRAIDMVGQMQVVLFLPEDLDLVSGPPARRRRYLDTTICQIDAYYCRHLQKYNRVLTQRNSLLRILRNRGEDPQQLAFWDEKLVEWGSYLIARRRQLLERMNQCVEHTHPELTGNNEHLRLCYKPSVGIEDQEVLNQELSTPLYQQPTVSQEEVQRIEGRFADQLQRDRAQEIARGTTQYGPHRDDICFMVDGVDMRTYGSRGQQRTVALALKFAELDLMREETDETPILLLDDVLSELDALRRHCLFAMVSDAEQVVITTTDMHLFPKDFLSRTSLWRVQEGCIRSENPPET